MTHIFLKLWAAVTSAGINSSLAGRGRAASRKQVTSSSTARDLIPHLTPHSTSSKVLLSVIMAGKSKKKSSSKKNVLQNPPKYVVGPVTPAVTRSTAGKSTKKSADLIVPEPATVTPATPPPAPQSVTSLSDLEQKFDNRMAQMETSLLLVLKLFLSLLVRRRLLPPLQMSKRSALIGVVMLLVDIVAAPLLVIVIVDTIIVDLLLLLLDPRRRLHRPPLLQDLPDLLVQARIILLAVVIALIVGTALAIVARKRKASMTLLSIFVRVKS